MHQLDKLPGHSQVKTYLAQLLPMPPSTMLFEGPRGVGKAAFARSFAHALLSDTNPHKLASGNHPDLRELYPEGKVFMHPIQVIKNLIDATHIPPFESKRKIFIIYEADRMLPSSSNALLKTLEEPPSYAHFILVTSHVESLLETILSRCLLIKFFPLSQDEIGLYLQKTLEKSVDEAHQISWLAQGSLAKAKDFVVGKDNHFFKMIAEMGAAALQRCYCSLSRYLKECEIFIEKNQIDFVEEVLTAIYYWYRDLHLLKIGGDPCLLFFRSHEEMLRESLNFPLPELSEIQKRIKRVQEALNCHISLRNCLTHLML